mgnify:CR=1 FL=1
MKRMSISLSIAVLAVALSVPAASLAAGGGSGSDTPTCANGEVYDKTAKKCVSKSSLNDQESIFEAGRALAYAGEYGEAIDLLSRAPNQQDERVLNMLGYSHRKLGMIDTGIAYYKHSIAVAPKYALVREYYGEALLQKGDLAGAHNQLQAIRNICEGEDCESYQMLLAAIESHGGRKTPPRRVW